MTGSIDLTFTRTLAGLTLKLVGPPAAEVSLIPGSVAPGISSDPGNGLRVGADGGLYAGAGAGRILQVDASRPLAYVGFDNQIVRLNYSTLPPTRAAAHTSDLATDWPNRASLAYTAQ